MRVAVLCATRRGHLFLERLAQLAPETSFYVFSFPEEPGEPPFLDGIRGLTEEIGGTFVETRQVGHARHAPFWESTPIDLLFAVSWRYMIPAAVYRRARLGAYVFHDSLLPTYRGFSPTVWAMVNGEDHTGVTLFEMADDVDSGAIVDQQPVGIGPDETIAEVLERVTRTYLALLERSWPGLAAGTAPRRPQNHALATYTCRRVAEDNRIAWSQPTRRVYDLVRALTAPYPGAFTTFDGRRLRIWEARPLTPERRYVGSVPGRVVEVRPGVGSVVLTGDGALLVTRVQLEDEAPVVASALLTSPSHTLGR